MVNLIIEKEWQMFDNVKNIGGRADCQDDWKTFSIMRSSAFCILREETLKSYYRDLNEAEAEGRNLITEKYAYMMEKTDPAYFREYLKPFLPAISLEKEGLAYHIVEMLTKDEKEFRKKYPALGEKGRDLTGEEAWASFYSYLLCELKTYSERTLQYYCEDVQSLLEQRISPSVMIHDEIARLYGYDGVAALEVKLVKDSC